jgi:DNA-binding NarL/FixJ family response regulator
MRTQITNRELEVLSKAADGLNEQAIAVSLMLERKEVQNCKADILKRLGVSDPLQALSLLAKNGFSIKN